MIILGIDPGTATTGYGAVEKKSNQTKLLTCGCILTSSKEKPDERLEKIFLDVMKLIKENKPDVLVCEELFYFKNAKTVIGVAQARGVVLLAARMSNVPVFEYTPLQIKQAVTGYGRADKRQVQEMTKALLGLEEILKPDDANDACAAAICHASNVQSLNC